LLLANVVVFYFGSAPVRLAAVALLFIGLTLDTVDGVVARKTGQTSLFGSVLDIAADRTYELVLWLCFADLGLIPLAIPLLVVARTTLTDAFRALWVGQGTAPFAGHQTPLGRFLVTSPFMRIGYTITKTTTFCGLALAQALGGFREGAGDPGLVPALIAVFQVTAWMAVGFCWLRGVPVIGHAIRHYWGVEPAGTLRRS
jgi:phosphatidylglycerophosphate synthase